MRRVEVANLQPQLIDAQRLKQAVDRVLEEADFAEAEVSLAIVDDATIWQLNRRHLEHDYPTDVLSFRLDDGDGPLEGEIIVSAEMATRGAAEFSWPPADELLLYVIHGALHLVGYDDHDADGAQQMRAAEARHLQHWGVERAAGHPFDT